MAQAVLDSPAKDFWRTKLTPEFRIKIIRLSGEGLSPTVIAKRFSVSAPTIRLVIKAYHDSHDSRKAEPTKATSRGRRGDDRHIVLQE